MSNHRIKLESGNFYHIYNRGINSCDLFHEPGNYEYFIRLYDKHVSSVAETFAWVLMRNHFHLLVRIREPHLQLNPQGFKNLEGLGEKEEMKKYYIQQFSNLFNAYSKAFNKKYKRTGSLFEHTFKRRLIADDEYLKQLIKYIHNNPAHHGFCKHPSEYPWSSYLTFVNIKQALFEPEEVLGWFDNHANFRYWHDMKYKAKQIDKWLEE